MISIGVYWYLGVYTGIYGYILVFFYAAFLRNSGSSEGLVVTTCLNTVVMGKQGHAPCKLLLLQ